MGFSIVGHGIAVPEGIETTETVSARLGCVAVEVERRSGVFSRHVANPTDDVAVMGAEACRQATNGGREPDLIISASAGVRQALPDSSIFISRALGYEGIPSFSINASCISFLVALRCATSLQVSGAFRRILLVSAEFCTRARNAGEPESYALLGDGAAAVMIEPDSGGAEIVHFELSTWPSGAELTEIRGCGVRRHPQDHSTTAEDNLFHMDGPGVLKRAALKMGRYLRSLDENVMRLDQIDVVIPHQMSGAGLELLKRAGFREGSVVDIVGRYGNCAAASIPMALATAIDEGRLRKGCHVLMLGTAAGLSVGGMLLRW